MIAAQVPLIGFAAYSGTGKTTLLTKLLPLFTEHRLRVGIIKRAHHSFEIDYPGKDSYELRKAGASQVLIGSRRRWALIVENESAEDTPLEVHLNNLQQDKLDLILVEGFKPENIPKIELHRPGLGRPLLFPEDETIIALAIDEAIDEKLKRATGLPLLDLNDPPAIAQFIIDHFLANTQTRQRR